MATLCTYKEDYDFSVRARKEGFKIVIVNNVLAYDINLREESYSDIYINMPLKDYLRGLRKKARAYVLGINFKVSIKDMIMFFLKNKRFLFYLGYIPIITLTLYGLLINNIFCILIYPAYITFYIFWQARKRDFKQILKSTTRSMIVGLPFSLLITYYFIKYSLIKK
jgi:GT2 family glycosyltransferase